MGYLRFFTAVLDLVRQEAGVSQKHLFAESANSATQATAHQPRSSSVASKARYESYG